MPVPPVQVQTFIPVPHAWASSVQHRHRYRTLQEVQHSISTGTGHFGNSVRHQYQFWTLFGEFGTASIRITGTGEISAPACVPVSTQHRSPVSDTSVCSVQDNPVPDCSVYSVRHQPGTATLWYQNKASIFRSDSQCQMFTFRPETINIFVYAVRYCKIRRNEVWTENRMAQVVRFWPTIWRLRISDSPPKNGTGLQSSRSVPEQIINTSYQKLPFGSADDPDKVSFTKHWTRFLTHQTGKRAWYSSSRYAQILHE